MLILAQYLGGEAEGYYLLLAGYLPLDLTALLGEDTSRARSLRHLISLPAERLDDVFRVLKALVEPYTEGSEKT